MDSDNVVQDNLSDEAKQEKLPIDARLLSEAVIELNISRRSVGLYPPDHPILKDSINRAFDLLKKLFELRSSITLGVAKDALVIDEYTLDRKNPVFQEFALSLHSKGIAAITFYSGLNVEGLVSLHELITMREGPVGSALLELAEKKGLSHIKLNPIDLSIFGFVEGQLKPGAPEGKIWEDYVHGLLEGRLGGRDAEDLVISIPPEQVAFIVNSEMLENAPEETYDRVISTYLRRKSRRGLNKEIFDRFLSFVDNLRPELKTRFLNRALSQPLSDSADIERMFAEIKEEDLKRFIDAFEKSTVTIPESLKNLVDKLIDTRAEGKKGIHTENFMKRMKAKGIDKIIIKKGVSNEELMSFISYLASKDEDTMSSEHILVGIVQVKLRSTGDGPLEIMNANISRVKGVYQEFSRFKKLDTVGLEDAVLGFLSAIKNEANVLRLVSPVKLFSEYTYVHTANVAVLTLFQAESLGMKGESLREAGLSGLLHDVGKMFIPKEVLEKPGKLDEAEWKEMKKHPVYGSMYLSSLPEPPRLSVIAAFEHHLKFDGGGYPDTKWRSRKQHIISQIVAISDFFDAVRAERPYRKGLELNAVLDIMKGSVGKDFNPLLIDNFISALKKAKVLS